MKKGKETLKSRLKWFSLEKICRAATAVIMILEGLIMLINLIPLGKTLTHRLDMAVMILKEKELKYCDMLKYMKSRA